MISKESYRVTAEENALLLKKLQHVEETLQHIEEELQQKEDQIRHQKERIAYLERMLYGSRRDKLSAKGPEEDNQPTLFDDEFKQAMEAKDAEIAHVEQEIKKEAAERRARATEKPQRPSTYRYAGLEERVRVVMPEGIDVEGCDILGKDVTRILHREPAKLWVEVIERPIFRSKSDKNTPQPRIYQAPSPKSIIGGNHVGADMLAQIIIDKYQYHLPEYRQVKQYADLGVKMPTSTLNDWVHAMASKLDPLYEALRDDIRSSDYLQVDEVPWRITDVPEKSRKGYAWQFLDRRKETHGRYFLYYGGSRAGTVPRAELRGYKGAIQTDGYRVYDYFEEQEDVTLLGCMAHVRRKFTDAQKSHPRLAAEAVRRIELLYTLERNLSERGASYEEIAAERQSKALPIMEAMEQWMIVASTQCTPSDSMGEALDYAYRLWPRLSRYAFDGRYQLDNNGVEQGQRPTVMGRKNFLFSKNDCGALDNAIFYSLIGSCEAVGIEPLKWLGDILERLTGDMPPEQVRDLLPFYYKKARE